MRAVRGLPDSCYVPQRDLRAGFLIGTSGYEPAAQPRKAAIQCEIATLHAIHCQKFLDVRVAGFFHLLHRTKVNHFAFE